MIKTNRKWILSFGIEWKYGVKYKCKQPFNLNKKINIQLKNNKKKTKQKDNRTAAQHETINLFINGQSLDLLVSPLKLSSHDFVDHVAHGFKTKKKCQAIVRV